ncbi:histidine kinase [Nonomuraea soli]|uniref:Two-component system sensor histidine kinase DesK n=1 Tax=Nonomuraea soli TaxID=1032476 RepID=A0A7W0CS70_9ACTN|nr:histidine kinase [Nonomuraea soli]MBA2896359.1 two-component system sensor histidine kinase DesK [Nonomuraea soli]
MRELQPGTARALLWAVATLLVVQRFFGTLTTAGGDVITAAAMTAVQAVMAVVLLGWRGPGALAVQAVLGFAPFVLFGAGWAPALWALAACALVVLPARRAWPVAVAVTVSAGVVGHALGATVWMAVWSMAVVVDLGLSIYGLASLTATVDRLAAAREELASAAVAAERARARRELTGRLAADLRALGFLIRQATPYGLARAAELARTTLARVRATAAAQTGVSAGVQAGMRAGREAGAPAGGPGSADGGGEPATVVSSRRWARGIEVTVLAGFSLVTAMNIAVYGAAGWTATLLGWAAVLAVLVLQLLPATPLRTAAQVVIVLTPGPWAVPWLVGLVPFPVSRMMRNLRSWLPAVAVTVAGGVLMGVRTGRSAEGLYVLLACAGLSLALFGLARLAELTARLEEVRRGLAEAALERERDRLARDLHDTLGLALSAIALRGELADTPERARAEAPALAELAEGALRDVGHIPDDAVGWSLREEVAAARGILRAAGIEVEVRMPGVDVPGEVGPAMATVLREAVTNVLRHSAARRCLIVVEEGDAQLRLLVRNDGAPPASPAGDGGSGLAGLAVRTSGRLSVRREPDGGFELEARFAREPA